MRIGKKERKFAHAVFEFESEQLRCFAGRCAVWDCCRCSAMSRNVAKWFCCARFILNVRPDFCFLGWAWVPAKNACIDGSTLIC